MVTYVITLPQILVSTANLVITLLTGILFIFASIFGVWGAIEYVGARGGTGRAASSPHHGITVFAGNLG